MLHFRVYSERPAHWLGARYPSTGSLPVSMRSVCLGLFSVIGVPSERYASTGWAPDMPVPVSHASHELAGARRRMSVHVQSPHARRKQHVESLTAFALRHVRLCICIHNYMIVRILHVHKHMRA
jgi:hypothetical protein